MRVLVIGGRFNNASEIGTCNGYIVAVRELTRYLSEYVDTFVLPIEPRLPTLARNKNRIGKMSIVPRYFSLRLFWTSILDLKKSLERIGTYTQNITSRPNASKRTRHLTGFYAIEYGYNVKLMERLIDELKPDLIHIHGFTLAQLPYFDTSFRRSICLVSTAHGLCSIDDKVPLWYDGKLEVDLFKKMDELGDIITVVSSGVKNDAMKHFDLTSDNIHVVINGVDRTRFIGPQQPKKSELRAKYGMQTDRKIILSVGPSAKEKINRLY